MRTSHFTLPILIVALAMLSGCAPRVPLAYERVEDRYERLALDNAIRRHASGPLDEAQTLLAEAEIEYRDDGPRGDFHHLLYLADRKLDIATARTRREIAEAQRERIIDRTAQRELDARERALRRGRLGGDRYSARYPSDVYRTDAIRREEAMNRLRRDLKFTRVERTSRGLEIVLADVVFASGSSVLQPGTRRKLQPLSNYLLELPQARVLIEGYADRGGSSLNNDWLSQARAEAVRDYFVTRGIDPGRVTARGLGAEHPSADTDPLAPRVQIVLLN